VVEFPLAATSSVVPPFDADQRRPPRRSWTLGRTDPAVEFGDRPSCYQAGRPADRDGNHGRQGLERALIGSVAKSVAHTARCPVLRVRSVDSDLTGFLSVRHAALGRYGEGLPRNAAYLLSPHAEAAHDEEEGDEFLPEKPRHFIELLMPFAVSRRGAPGSSPSVCNVADPRAVFRGEHHEI